MCNDFEFILFKAQNGYFYWLERSKSQLVYLLHWVRLAWNAGFDAAILIIMNLCPTNAFNSLDISFACIILSATFNDDGRSDVRIRTSLFYFTQSGVQLYHQKYWNL